MALKRQTDIALVRRDVVYDLIIEHDLTTSWFDQPCHHTQSRRLAAAGWSEQGHELAFGDVGRHVIDGDRRTIPFRYVNQPYARHPQLH